MAVGGPTFCGLASAGPAASAQAHSATASGASMRKRARAGMGRDMGLLLRDLRDRTTGPATPLLPHVAPDRLRPGRATLPEAAAERKRRPVASLAAAGRRLGLGLRGHLGPDRPAGRPG